MKPSRDLDVLIAEKVLGKEIYWGFIGVDELFNTETYGNPTSFSKQEYKGINKEPTVEGKLKNYQSREYILQNFYGNPRYVMVPEYSTDIKAAWDLLESIKDPIYGCGVFRIERGPDKGRYQCLITRYYGSVDVIRDTPCLAICAAVLIHYAVSYNHLLEQE